MPTLLPAANPIFLPFSMRVKDGHPSLFSAVSEACSACTRVIFLHLILPIPGDNNRDKRGCDGTQLVATHQPSGNFINAAVGESLSQTTTAWAHQRGKQRL